MTTNKLILLVLAALLFAAESHSGATDDRASRDHPANSAQPVTAPQPSSASFDPSEINSTFRQLSDSETPLVEISLRDKYFRNGDPSGYRRHVLYHIDTASLRRQLEAASQAATPGSGIEYTPIPLFEDLTHHVAIEDWTYGGFGVTVGTGHSNPADNGPHQARFVFDENGGLMGSITGRDVGYLISAVQDDVYYVVMELELPDRID